jgi:hypothetical protein
VDINDEWPVAHRYISQAAPQLILPEPEKESGDQSRADQPALQGALAGAAKSTT